MHAHTDTQKRTHTYYIYIIFRSFITYRLYNGKGMLEKSDKTLHVVCQCLDLPEIMLYKDKSKWRILHDNTNCLERPVQ